jgi:hypothetical protein
MPSFQISASSPSERPPPPSRKVPKHSDQNQHKPSPNREENQALTHTHDCFGMNRSRPRTALPRQDRNFLLHARRRDHSRYDHILHQVLTCVCLDKTQTQRTDISLWALGESCCRGLLAASHDRHRAVPYDAPRARRRAYSERHSHW